MNPWFGGVAQLTEHPDGIPGGRRFNPSRPYQEFIFCSFINKYTGRGGNPHFFKKGENPISDRTLHQNFKIKKEKKMRQKMELELTQKPTILLEDMIDLQGFALSAEATAQKLIEKYGNNLKKIKEEVNMGIGGEDKEFAKEVIWAACWILSMS